MTLPTHICPLSYNVFKVDYVVIWIIRLSLQQLRGYLGNPKICVSTHNFSASVIWDGRTSFASLFGLKSDRLPGGISSKGVLLALHPPGNSPCTLGVS